MRSRRIAAVFLPALCTLALCGCSSRLTYDIGQAWQRGQCERMPDQGGRAQCVSGTSTSYDNYQRQSAGTIDN